MELINIIIPTCNRPKTLFWAVKSCLNQDNQHFRLWVSDNSTNDESYEVIRQFSDSRLSYLRTPEPLAMSDNFEFALGHIEEGYVTFIGDDDGFFPNGINNYQELIRKTNQKVIVNFKPAYFWPEIIKGGLVSFIEDNRYFFVNAKELLDYAFEKFIFYPEFFYLPEMYGNIIHFDIIKKIRDRDGGKFFNSAAPDVYSAAIISGEIDKYVLCFSPPIFLNGTSKYSSGYNNALYGDKNTIEEIRSNYRMGFKKNRFHRKLENEDSIMLISTSALTVAEAFLSAHEKNPDIPAPDIRKVIDRILMVDAWLVDTHEKFITTLNEARRVAKINNLEDYAEIRIKQVISKPPGKDYLDSFDNSPWLDFSKYITFNTIKAGATNVFEASTLFNDYVYSNFEHFPTSRIVVDRGNFEYFETNLRLDANSEYFLQPRFKPDKDKYGNISFYIRNEFVKDPLQNEKDCYYILRKLSHFSFTSENVFEINNSVDQIWVPSSYVKDFLSSIGIIEQKIKILPFSSVESEIYSPEAKPVYIDSEKNFKYLFVGGLNENNGVKELIISFSKAFSFEDDVALLIQEDYLTSDKNYKEEIILLVEKLKNDINVPEIILLNEYIAPGLYTASDCFVLPYRYSEFNINALESMSCGVPVLITSRGFSNDYCDDSNSFLIESSVSEKNSEKQEFIIEHYDIDYSQLENILRIIPSQTEILKNKSINARKTIENILNWEAFFHHVNLYISELSTLPVIRFDNRKIIHELERKAFSYFEQKDYLNSSRLLENLCKSVPSNVEYNYKLGISKFNLGSYDEALVFFRKAIELKGISDEILNYIGITLEKLGDVKTADIYLNKRKKL